MNIETIIMHITPVGGNIFEDLWFEPEEAARLKAETDQAIDEKLALKKTKATAIPTTPTTQSN